MVIIARKPKYEVVGGDALKRFHEFVLCLPTWSQMVQLGKPLIEWNSPHTLTIEHPLENICPYPRGDASAKALV